MDLSNVPAAPLQEQFDVLSDCIYYSNNIEVVFRQNTWKQNENKIFQYIQELVAF